MMNVNIAKSLNGIFASEYICNRCRKERAKYFIHDLEAIGENCISLKLEEILEESK